MHNSPPPADPIPGDALRLHHRYRGPTASTALGRVLMQPVYIEAQGVPSTG